MLERPVRARILFLDHTQSASAITQHANNGEITDRNRPFFGCVHTLPRLPRVSQVGQPLFFFTIDMDLLGKKNTTDVFWKKYRGWFGTTQRILMINRAMEVDSPFKQTTTGK